MDDRHSVTALTKSPCLGNASRVKRYKNSHIFIITICIFGIFAELEDKLVYMLYQRSVEEGTLTRQDPVLSPKTLYRTAAPPSGYETENSTHYLKMASSELSSFIAISLIIKTTYRCHLTVK